MTTENTPLSGSSNSDSNSSSILNALLTKENTDAAKKYAKNQVELISRMLKDGHTSIRFLALVGGVAMSVTSALGVVDRILSLHWISAIVGCYTTLLGVVAMLLECRSANLNVVPKEWSVMWEERLRKYALFLTFVSGRGALYFVAGTLQFSQLTFIDLLVGGYMAAIGVTYIIVGKQTAIILSTLRKSIVSEHMLTEKFQAAVDVSANAGQSPSLSMEEFRNMLSSQFGIQFSERELEISFSHMDGFKSRDGRVTLEEFLEWWQKDNTMDEANMAEFGLTI